MTGYQFSCKEDGLDFDNILFSHVLQISWHRYMLIAYMQVLVGFLIKEIIKTIDFFILSNQNI